ncbi:MAG: hypothetical protein IJF37_02635 [Lachnospiraceae bacterium]|nr:hypothetical protein [Lachnospiraceae bacterium]
MAKRRVDEDYIEFEDIVQKIKRKHIPPLTLDVKWQAIFNTPDKPSNIAKLEKQLNDIIKRQGGITNDRKDLKRIKKQLMQEIVENMDSPEDSRADKKVKKSKELIDDINDKLILLEDEELDIPDNMAEINAQLMLESMDEILDSYEENEEDIEVLESWINETRIELKKRVLLLQKKKEENAMMEKYLLDMVDSDIIRDYKKYREQS